MTNQETADKFMQEAGFEKTEFGDYSWHGAFVVQIKGPAMVKNMIHSIVEASFAHGKKTKSNEIKKALDL